MGEKHASGGDPAAVGDEMSLFQMERDALVRVVGLGDEEVRSGGAVDEDVGPGRATRVGEGLCPEVEAEGERWSAARVVYLPGAG